MQTETTKPRQNFFRSLRFRFMLMLILIGIIPTGVTSWIVVNSYLDRAITLRESNVRNQCDLLANLIISEGMLDNIDSILLDRELTLLGNVYNGRLMIINGAFRVVKDTFGLDTGRTSVSKELIDCFIDGKGTTYYDRKNAYIEVIVPITGEDDPEVSAVLMASVSTNEIMQTVRHLENQAIMIMGGTSLLVLIFGILLANLLVRPFREVTRAIEDVTDGFEDKAISVPDYLETEQIIEAFNNMLSRVRALDNSRQEFVSNVSHELKTPLTSMKVLADSLNGMDNVPPEIYREFMADITQEIDRENNIITSLLAMVRMDRNADNMTWSEEEIGALLERIVKRLRPIADKRGISIETESARPVTAEVDEMKISLAFSNLIENAVKYNVPDGWVRVTLKSDSKYFYVTVSDGGLGIPESQIDHIFERFYRGDKSHSTEIEGTGLGLAITRSAILLHRGVIKVSSKEGAGTSFMVRIPLRKQE